MESLTFDSSKHNKMQKNSKSKDIKIYFKEVICENVAGFIWVKIGTGGGLLLTQ
jgi:hypothetical protein